MRDPSPILQVIIQKKDLLNRAAKTSKQNFIKEGKKCMMEKEIQEKEENLEEMKEEYGKSSFIIKMKRSTKGERSFIIKMGKSTNTSNIHRRIFLFTLF